ncbi:MAG TPA: hypothetical protein PKI35_06825 [Bacteroidales bacterium]|nr:hypothetical protein [Bacteroidales bacterium]
MNEKLIPPPDLNLNGEPLPETATHTLKTFEPYRITDTTQIPAPVPVIKISGETISTPEHITVISGAPKSGKTSFCSILIAGAISKTGEIFDTLDLVNVLPNRNQLAVIHFETEQAPWKHQANQAGILKRAGLDHCPGYYLSYNIRQIPIEELNEFISGVCQAAAAQFGGIFVVFVDGIADLIRDPNDQAESFDVVKFLEGIAQEYFCPVIVVLHTNPGSDKERGHLGSQVQRKAESVLQVKKEGNVSYLDPKLLRHAGDDIPKVQFQYDRDKGYHVQCNVDNPTDRRAIQKVEKLEALAGKVFSGQAAFKYSDAINVIIRHTGYGQTTAKRLFTEMKACELIEQGNDNNWRKVNKPV